MNSAVANCYNDARKTVKYYLQSPKGSRQEVASFKNKAENVRLGVTQNWGALGSLYPGLLLVGPNS